MQLPPALYEALHLHTYRVAVVVIVTVVVVSSSSPLVGGAGDEATRGLLSGLDAADYSREHFIYIFTILIYILQF